MAFCLSSSSVMSLLLFLSVSSLFSIRADLIADVCHPTINPGYCEKAMRSDPRSARAVPLELCTIAIDLATTSAAGTSNKILSLGQKTCDIRLKALFDNCLEFYQGGINALQDAKTYLSHGDYPGVNVLSAGAYGAGDRCERSFTPPYNSPLSTENNDIKLLSDILAAISNFLGDNVQAAGAYGGASKCENLFTAPYKSPLSTENWLWSFLLKWLLLSLILL